MKTLMSAVFVVAVTFIAQISFALTNSAGNKIADAALTRLGTPYVWGGKTTAGFDCSGLAGWAYRQGGISSLPMGTSHNQWQWCTLCTNQRGALLFFDTDFNGVIDHVAIRDTGDFMIHAVDRRGVVREKMSSWYRARLVVSASR